MRIITRDSAGQPNGFLIPIWRADSGDKIEQVYCTTIKPGMSKGPHLHKVRCGRFTVIRGDVEIVLGMNGGYEVFRRGDSYGHETVKVEPGIPAMLRNIGDVSAYVLNMPTPAWSSADPDEWPVEGWDYKS